MWCYSSKANAANLEDPVTGAINLHLHCVAVSSGVMDFTGPRSSRFRKLTNYSRVEVTVTTIQPQKDDA